MYPVLCVWNCITAVYVPDRNAAIGNILDARMPILYAGVMSCGVAYTLQMPRTEACESGDCITAFKYGILFFRTFRLDNIRRNTVSERRNRLCVDVCSNYTCTASGQEREIKKWADIKELCKYEKTGERK